MVLLILLGLIKISENPHPVSFFGLVNYQYSVGMVSLLVSRTLRTSNVILTLKDIFCNVYTWEKQILAVKRLLSQRLF